MNKDAKIVNKIIEGERMAVEAFNVLIDVTHDKKIKNAFQDMQQKNRRNISHMARFVQDMGEIPDEKLGLKGVYADVALKVGTYNKSDKDLIISAIDGLEMGIKNVESELENHMDHKAEKLLKDALKNHKDSIDTLNKLM